MNTEIQRKLDKIFNPESVAVIGASSRQHQFSNRLTLGLSKGQFKGKVYPVNPNLSELHGLQCFPDLQPIPNKVDLAYVAVPAAMVSEVMRQCVDKRVEGCVIYTSGFAEVGEDGGSLSKRS